MSRTVLVLFAVVVVACSSAGPVDSTVTTAADASTTTVESMTTSTTGAGTTSTSSSTTTTTPIVLEDVPLVVAGQGVLGWWDGSEWRSVEGVFDGELEPLPVSGDGGAEYRLFSVGSEPRTDIGSEPQDLCNGLGWFIEFDDELFAWDPLAPGAIAISAPWDASPNLVEVLPVSETYRQVARDLLATRGIEESEPDIVQLIRTDIDGDGAFEVFGVVERKTAEHGGLIPAPAGDYSIAFARFVIDEEVQTAILGEWVVEEQTEDGFIQDLVVFRYSAFLDADGDGDDEVAVKTSYYEGAGTTLYDWMGPDLGLVDVISAGCGA